MAENEMPKAYDPKAVEDAIYDAWEKSGFFNPDKLPARNQKGNPFTTMMPPPNVTGVLHLGHVWENALMDTMARFERMRGKKVLIVPGTDHAALPTHAKVEKMLIAQGMKNPRKELGRERLVAKIREFAEQSRATILMQIKKIGTSCDWSRLAYTFDEERGRAVNEMFRRMYEDGLIYRGSRVVNWSVKGQSTCSDDEVVHVERPAKLYTFKYGKDFPIAIASTRPETKLGDTAVAVHPADKRYKKFVGKIFRVDVGAARPLEIKIIADESIDRNFGTGALGVTPAHSPVDFEMYEKQKAKGDPIGLVAVIGTHGKMTAAAGKEFQGLTVEDAREKFISWLKKNNLLEKEEEITQNVGTSDRFGDVIEAIPLTQWWLDMNKKIPGRGKNLKDIMREALTEDKIIITPERFKKIYLDRVANLRDWCLSRQIWWGHRIPVWYRGDAVRVSASSPGAGWEQDPDTLDTWFSSGLWTFSTLGWPDKTADLKTFHPTDWMQMGYEIIYLWMMRMILMSGYALKQIPFQEVYLHGILRDESGKKFSKSAGNTVDPLEIIEKYGTDALRWSVLAGTTPGNDARFYYEKIEGARNLVNKIWNISRYILSNVAEGFSPPPNDGNLKVSATPKTQTLADRWILARLNHVTQSVTTKLADHEFSLAGDELREFTWGDLADWYLEIAKVEGVKTGILRHVLETILKIWHPFLPFITESIWQKMGHKDLLMIAEWPKAVKATVPKEFEVVREVMTAVRSLRAAYHVEPARTVDVVLSAGAHQQVLDEQSDVIRHLGRISTLAVEKKAKKPAGAAGAVVKGVEVFVQLAGVVDLEKEKKRLSAERENLARYAASLEKKLGNGEFAAKAPPAVVAAEKEKFAHAREELQKLEAQIQSL